MSNIRFQDGLAEQMESPTFREAYEKYTIAHQVVRLRMERGLTQAQVAERVGTTQPSIARLESGSREPRLSFLRRVVKALDGRLEVRIAPAETVEETATYESSPELSRSVAEPHESYDDGATSKGAPNARHTQHRQEP